jgi:hypothetical protein
VRPLHVKTLKMARPRPRNRAIPLNPKPLHVKTLKMARPRPRNRAIPRRAARDSYRPAAGPRAQSETEGQRQALVTEGIAASNLVVFVCTDEHNPFNSRLLASAFHTAYREGKKQLLVANSPTVRPCPGTGAPPHAPVRDLCPPCLCVLFADLPSAHCQGL